MKTTDFKILTVRALTIVFLLFSCFYMYDFYKCLSGFIANGFREPTVMLPMILAYFLPVLCFLIFVYDVYVSAIAKRIKVAYSAFVAIYAIILLIFLFCNVRLYVSNNALGVYDALPSIFLHFPFDMLIIIPIILALQIFKVAALCKKASVTIYDFRQNGALTLGTLEYILLCILAIIVFVFTGSAICASFTAYENVFYDLKYAFLLIWVMLIPMLNLVLIVIKPEKRKLEKRAKINILCLGIAENLIFTTLFLIFEFLHPDFLIHISKPLFLIAFSVSLPIEPLILLVIMAVSTVIFLIRLLRVLKASKIN